MRKRSSTIALAALVLALGAAAVAVAADGEDGQVRKIKIKRVHCAEGQDCDEGPHQVIMIDEDGTEMLVGGEAEWTAADGTMLAHHLLAASPAGGFLGVQLTDLTPELRAHFGVPEDAGVLVASVVADSAAERAGIEVGDVVTLVDGESVGSARALAGAIGGHEQDDAVTLEIWRDGRAQQLTATLGEIPRPFVRPRMILGHPGGHHGMDDGLRKRIEIRCEDGEEDCGLDVGAMDLDVACESGECEVRVLCDEDGCECTVDGADVDCAEIGVPHG